MTYGDKLKTARKESGLTQAELAKRCGLATITIQQYERNLREPKYEVLYKIAEALGMPSPAYFVFDPIPDETEKPAPISESGSNKARLLAILNQLSDANQAQLLSFAEFLKDSERK